MFLLYQLDCHLSLKMSLKMISRKELEPCCCYCCFHQYPALPDYYKFILITVLIVMTLIEAIRLFLGYTGNLQEKVAHHSHKHGTKKCKTGSCNPFDVCVCGRCQSWLDFGC